MALASASGTVPSHYAPAWHRQERSGRLVNLGRRTVHTRRGGYGVTSSSSYLDRIYHAVGGEADTTPVVGSTVVVVSDWNGAECGSDHVPVYARLLLSA